MAKRNFASFLLIAVAGITLAPVTSIAQPAVGAADGCTILAELVYAQVVGSGLSGPGRFAVAPEPLGRDEMTVCHETTRVTSKAFTAALVQMNIYVTWNDDPGDSGDYCASHYLSQCYPDRDPLDTFATMAESVFLHDTWRAVQHTVGRRMPSRFASDTARFSASEIRRSLRDSLAKFTTGTLQEYQLVFFER
jgi:hypothetical protein